MLDFQEMEEKEKESCEENSKELIICIDFYMYNYYFNFLISSTITFLSDLLSFYVKI